MTRRDVSRGSSGGLALPLQFFPEIWGGRTAFHFQQAAEFALIEDFAAVRTAAEQGLPSLDLTTWFALYAPAETPDAVVQALAARIRTVAASQSYKDRLLDQGAYGDFLGPKELGDLTARDLAYWKPIIEKAGIRLD